MEDRQGVFANAFAHCSDWWLTYDVGISFIEGVEVMSIDLQAELRWKVGEAIEGDIIVSTLQYGPERPWAVPLACRSGEATLANERLEFSQLQHFVRHESALRAGVKLFDSFPWCDVLDWELPLFQHLKQGCTIVARAVIKLPIEVSGVIFGTPEPVVVGNLNHLGSMDEV